MTEHSDPAGWPALLASLLGGRALTSESTAWAMDQVMRGLASPAQLAGLLVALRAKGETAEEVLGLVRSMHAHAVRLDVPGPALDIVGTGGDGSDSVNISTMAAIVAAGAGARVVKHGNRSASSACGSADVLEELGVPLRLPPGAVAQVAAEAGITFCFAPVFHPAARHAAPVRRELGVRTIFNCLGPLTNPASPTALAVGVADPALAPVVARTLALRGVSALVFRGDDGMDELTVTTTSRVWSVHGGEVRAESFDPRDAGVPLSPGGALRGGDARFNAEVVRAVLGGERGAVRDAVLLSAAAGLAALDASVAGRPVTGSVTERIAAGLDRAARAVDSGAAAGVLDRWVAVSGKLAGAAG
ncbi:anthranilate phosphoribosyltransferase [Streptomyces sp. 130]|uniref:anthranilate phosphoribosyltransferase n=1 Tax=Streptomyces sp. 130 TaxID=2591006 RepID=UPI00117E669B|nr:anthranilate phosphoribosyltransferase [Streptomyces sp. 130]TRV73041.1 anthranilate phosphoribosyltransferase [Streptomyces sp. 130]